jgi:site-specific DNA recombinase
MSTQKKANKPVVGYTRVSTGGQAVDGVSLDAQRERIEAWCRANDHELTDVRVDAGLKGGRADNRPALQVALDTVCQSRGVLVVYSLSRLARSTRDTLEIAERLDRAGADLVSLTERIDTTTAAGRMVFRMLAVLAEFERDLISERTTTALRHKQHQGEKQAGTFPSAINSKMTGGILWKIWTSRSSLERFTKCERAGRVTELSLTSYTDLAWNLSEVGGGTQR